MPGSEAVWRPKQQPEARSENQVLALSACLPAVDPKLEPNSVESQDVEDFPIETRSFPGVTGSDSPVLEWRRSRSASIFNLVGAEGAYRGGVEAGDTILGKLKNELPESERKSIRSKGNSFRVKGRRMRSPPEKLAFLTRRKVSS